MIALTRESWPSCCAGSALTRLPWRNGLGTLKQLARSYLAMTKDLTRVMNRLKALYRSQAIPCADTSVYVPCYRADWLKKLTEAGLHRRAERLYQQLDVLRSLHQEAREDLVVESRKHGETRLLRRIPSIGPIRAALLVAIIQTPHRFRTKRQLWAYSGLAFDTRTSGEYRYVEGRLRRSKKLLGIRGLNENHNHDLKYLFKSTAPRASRCAGPFQQLYASLLAREMKPTMARLTLAQDRRDCFDALEERRMFRR